MPVGKFVCNKWHKSPRILSSIISKNFQWNKQNPSTILTYNRYYEKVGPEVKDITDDLPFEIPDTWVWTRFSQIVSFGLGKTPDRHTDKFWSSGIYPWFAISDLQEKATVYSTKEKISATALKEKFSGKLIPQGTLLMSFKLTVGRTSILGIDAVHNEAIISVFPIIPDNDATRNFLFNTLSLIVSYVETTDAIKGATLNSSKISSMFVPFPPLAEQIRIVKEIEKFEPLIAEYDKLEQQATKLDDEIYDKLKKSILQYAIQGKLVPQDPNDEPASVLLERIRAEKKAKLGKKYVDSYIYKGDDNCYYEKVGTKEPIRLDDMPFDIPDSWRWIRIDNLFQHNTGKTLNSSNMQGVLHPYITTSNVYWGYFNLERIKEMPFTEDEFAKCSIVPGDLLVCEGGDVGRAAIWENDIPMCIQNHIHRLRAYYPMCTPFYYFAFFVYKSIGLIGGKGIGIQGLSSGALGKLIFPLPPLVEQERIVKQVEIILEKLKDED